MSEQLNTTFMLMGVGMITVFIVLLFVVIIGNVLIAFVNKYVPLVDQKVGASSDSNHISPIKIAAITSAVEVFTKGKGKISSITNINK